MPKSWRSSACGVAALLDDLESRGLLDETLVVVTGEFGRTPRIGASTGNNNTRDGRDHWAAVFSAALAGGGVQGGQTIGRADKIGAYHASRPYAPADLAATIYQSLGIDPATEARDRLNRPVRLCTGEPIAPLFSAARTVGQAGESDPADRLDGASCFQAAALSASSVSSG